VSEIPNFAGTLDRISSEIAICFAGAATSRVSVAISPERKLVKQPVVRAAVARATGQI
jgi:hypothetical protein